MGVAVGFDVGKREGLEEGSCVEENVRLSPSPTFVQGTKYKHGHDVQQTIAFMTNRVTHTSDIVGEKVGLKVGLKVGINVGLDEGACE